MNSGPARAVVFVGALLSIFAVNAICQDESAGATTLLAMNSASSSSFAPANDLSVSEMLPSEPAPASAGDHWNVAPAGIGHQQPFSRLGVGTNLSPLGIGVSATTILTDYIDIRLMGSFFGMGVNQLNDGGVVGDAHLHFASMATSLDLYPYNRKFRLSPGMMFFNQNNVSAHTTSIASGISMDGQTYYAATIVPGSTPLQVSANLDLHPRPIAFTLTGGYGKFVPRSQRHWSFPSEFGVIFMGTPAVTLNSTGWVCLDFYQTQCSDVANTASPVTQQFNASVQNQLAKWRNQLNRVSVYPIISFGVVYSFDMR
jgi:hypothetical protein